MNKTTNAAFYHGYGAIIALAIYPHEFVEMCPQLPMAVVMEAFDGCLFDYPVHSFHQIIRPGMIGFRQAAFDTLRFADHVKVHEGHDQNDGAPE